ncbi:MAG: nucleotidyltransferase domain-containing protein [Nanoarchaeota archaeon]|nr:nucleotidyltransferase domain-containing protein [Nanoarchaeota archaeon]
MKDFWNNWKNKTEIEERAIVALKKARQIILKNVPLEELIAIYVKGSFVRRELNEKSDIDTVTILKTNKYRKKIEELDKEYKSKEIPRLEFSSFSLWELENNKHFYTDSKLRASPDRFVIRISCYKLIYGKQLDTSKFKVRNSEESLKDLKNAFYKSFIPLYNQKKFDFQEIIKQVFWLIELEEQRKGKKCKNSWKELDNSIKDKNHLVHESYRLRLNPPKDQNIKEDYIKQLTTYLEELK